MQTYKFDVCSLCVSMEVNTFLGRNGFAGSVENCTLALTTYTGDPVYEEWHTHDKSSISFLLDGTYEEELHRKQYTRTAGNVKFIAAGELHRCHGYTSSTRKINLEFNTALLQALSVTEEQLTEILPASLHTRHILLQLFRELSENRKNINAAAQQLLYGLLFNADGENMTGKTQPAWVPVLKELLHDEWNNNLSLQQMAAATGVHPVTISRYFPRYFSSSLGDYMRMIKVDKALVMIRSTPLSLTQIAYDCGFADQAHFTRIFKSVTGFLPKEFRKL